MRKRGRPPLYPGEPIARVQVTVSARQYDELDARGRARGLSVPAMMRRGVSRVLDDERSNSVKKR